MGAFFIAFFGIIYIVYKLIKESADKAYIDAENERIEREREKYKDLYYDNKKHNEVKAFIRNNTEEAYRLLHDDLTFIFGSDYRSKIDISKEDYGAQNYAAQLLMAHEGKYWDWYKGVSRHGICTKWGDEVAIRIYQRIEYHLKKKYPDIKMFAYADVEYNAKTRKREFSWEFRNVAIGFEHEYPRDKDNHKYLW